MKKVLVLLFASAVCCMSLSAWDNGTVNPVETQYEADIPRLKDGEILWCRSEQGFLIFSAGETEAAAREIFRTSKRAYHQQCTDARDTWWFVMNNSTQEYPTCLFCIDGKKGTVRYLCEVQYSFRLSEDGRYIVVQDSMTVVPRNHMREECPFYFDVLEAGSGKQVGRVEWMLYNTGNEMEISRSHENPMIMTINYKPAGLWYAEALLDLNDMTLKIIRDDSRLKYEELPEKYRKDMHP